MKTGDKYKVTTTCVYVIGEEDAMDFKSVSEFKAWAKENPEQLLYDIDKPKVTLVPLGARRKATRKK